MQNKFISLRKAGLVGIGGALALTAVTNASAVSFDVDATVQNTLTVTVDQAMNLGTLFAVNASSNTEYSYMILEPDGTMDADPTYRHANIPFLSLGGATAARGSVAVGSTTTFNIAVPCAIPTNTPTTTAAITPLVDTNCDGTATTVQLRIGGTAGDPTVARFYLVNFVAGDATGGTIGAPAGTTLDLYPATPSFGSTSLGFGIGATIITDVSGTRTTYEAGVYEGTFEVTASY